MRAVAYSGYGVTPELTEVADPACPADGVVGLSAVMIASALGAHVVAVDVSIDALGSAAVAANSVRCLRRRGRHVQVGLLPEGSVPLPMDLVIALEDAGRALAAMSKVSATAGMTVVRLPERSMS